MVEVINNSPKWQRIFAVLNDVLEKYGFYWEPNLGGSLAALGYFHLAFVKRRKRFFQSERIATFTFQGSSIKFRISSSQETTFKAIGSKLEERGIGVTLEVEPWK